MERINLPSPQFSSQALQLSFLKAVVQRPAGQSRNGICPINSPNKEFVSYEIKADTVLLSYNNFSHHITNNSLLLHFPDCLVVDLFVQKYSKSNSSDFIISFLMSDEVVIEVHFTQISADHSIFQEFYSLVEEINGKGVNDGKTISLAFTPQYLDSIKQHSAHMLPVRSSNRLSSIQNCRFLSQNRILGFLLDGSLVHFDRQTTFFSESVISANVGGGISNIFSGVLFGIKKETQSREIISSHFSGDLAASITREGLLHFYSLSDDILLQVSDLFNRFLIANSKSLNDCDIKLFNVSGEKFYVSIVFATVDQPVDWKLVLLLLIFDGQNLQISEAIRPQTLSLTNLISKNSSIQDVLAITLTSSIFNAFDPIRSTTEESSQRFLLCLLLDVNALFTTETTSFDQKMNSISVLLRFDGSFEDIDSDVVFPDTICQNSAVLLENVVRNATSLSAALLLLRDKMIELLFRNKDYSLLTVLKALENFTKADFPFDKLLTAFEQQSIKTLRSSHNVSTSIADLVLQELEAKCQSSFTGKFGETLTHSGITSTETKFLLCYQKSSIDFLNLCEFHQMKENEKSSCSLLVANPPDIGAMRVLIAKANASMELLEASSADKTFRKSYVFASFGKSSERQKIVSMFLDKFYKDAVKMKAQEQDLLSIIGKFVQDSEGCVFTGPWSVSLEAVMSSVSGHRSISSIILEEINQLSDKGLWMWGDSNAADSLSKPLLAYLRTHKFRRNIRHNLYILFDFLYFIDYLSDYGSAYLSLTDLTHLTGYIKSKVLSLVLANSALAILGEMLPKRTVQNSNECSGLFLPKNDHFNSVPFLAEDRSLLENYFLLASDQTSSNCLGLNESLKFLDFLLHYQQFSAINLWSLAVSGLADKESQLSNSVEEQFQANLTSQWISAVNSYARFYLLRRTYQEKSVQPSNLSVLDGIRLLVNQSFGDLLSKLMKLDVHWRAMFDDDSQFLYKLMTESSHRTCLCYGMQGIVRSVKLSPSDFQMSKQLVLLWSLVQQSNLCEDYARVFSSNEIIYAQAVQNIHRICLSEELIAFRFADRENLVQVWKSFSLRTLKTLAEACDNLSYVPRVVTQGLISTLSATSTQQDSNSQFKIFQRAFCSDFFRNLASKGQFLSLFQLERFLKLHDSAILGNDQLQMNFVDDLYHSLFTCEPQQKELFLELIFAIHILKNDYRRAAQLFFQPPIPELQTARRLAIAINLFSFLPENERYELSRRAVDEIPAVSRVFDVHELTSKLAVRYGYESLMGDPAERGQLDVASVSSADEVVNQLVKFGFWQESLIIRTAQQRFRIDQESKELQASVEGLLLLFTGLVNQDMMSGVNCLMKLHSACSFVDHVRSSGPQSNGAADFGNEWILHQISCFVDCEGSRAAFLSYWKFFAASTPHNQMFKRLTACYISCCRASDRNPLAVSNPLPFMLAYGRLKESAQMVSEIYSSTEKPVTGMSEFWLSRLRDELEGNS